MDPDRLELPARSFDLVLALGAAPTVLGRASLLERSRFYLKPGGRVLLADLVYLNSPAPATAVQLLRELQGADHAEPSDNAPDAVVRALLEQGRYRFETESDYRQLAEAIGYEVMFSFLVPESEWAEYFERRSREYGERIAVDADGEARHRLAEEAGVFYAFGGRGRVGYLVLGAKAVDHED
jgi:hypothetical protein